MLSYNMFDYSITNFMETINRTAEMYVIELFAGFVRGKHHG